MCHSENKQAGNRLFTEALKFEPFLDMHFRIFRAEQDRLQETQSMNTIASSVSKHSGGDLSEALITHLEFQKNIVGAKRFHKGAVRAFRKFWSLLLSEDVTLTKLESAVAAIDYNETRAQEHYKSLLAQHPNNPRILRSYGKFHEEVLRDNEAAQDLYDAADEYEETAAAQQKGARFKLDEDLSDDGGREDVGADDGRSVLATEQSASNGIASFGNFMSRGAPVQPQPPPPALNAAPAAAPTSNVFKSASVKLISFGPSPGTTGNNSAKGIKFGGSFTAPATRHVDGTDENSDPELEQELPAAAAPALAPAPAPQPQPQPQPRRSSTNEAQDRIAAWQRGGHGLGGIGGIDQPRASIDNGTAFDAAATYSAINHQRSSGGRGSIKVSSSYESSFVLPYTYPLELELAM
eukprot:tig00021167_g19065.t1